jgi:hypothetical protein
MDTGVGQISILLTVQLLEFSMLVDETHAVMTQREFDGLLEYSCSVPTGQSIGKRWKVDRWFGSKLKNGPRWWMGEYSRDFKDGRGVEMVEMVFREILIV